MEYLIKNPVYCGKRIKEYGVVVKMPTTECSDTERDYMRIKYICKLLEWKRAEMEAKRA